MGQGGTGRTATWSTAGPLLWTVACLPWIAAVGFDAWSQVADLQILQARRGFTFMVLGLVSVAIASVPIVRALRSDPRMPARPVGIAAFLAFDWFAAMVLIRLARGRLVPLPLVLVFGSAVVVALLLIVVAATWARDRRARTRQRNG